jgi:hypothetical protein
MGVVDTTPDVAAGELFDDYQQLMGEFMDKKISTLDIIMKPVEPAEQFLYYLNMSRKDRLAEIKALKERIEQLEALEYNWSVVGLNIYISQVVEEMKIIQHKREGDIIEFKAAKRQRSRETTPSGDR